MGSWWAYYDARLGRLLVLGPGRERLLHAVARRHGAAALGARDGEAQRAESHLDHPARDPRLLAVLIGTFLVRSGVLTSVHAFAVDPARGIFILVHSFGVFIGGALALFALRAPTLEAGRTVRSRSAARARSCFNNLILMTCACAAVFVGTLYPLALEAVTGDKISVGAPFFNATFGPLFLPLLLAAPFGPLLAWKRGDLLGVAQRLLGAAALAVIGIAVVLRSRVAARSWCRSPSGFRSSSSSAP